MQVHLRKYGVEATIPFELYDPDGVDFKEDAVDGGTDCSINKDEAGQVVATNDFADVGFTYKLVVTATEMQAKRIVGSIRDAPTKAYLDKTFLIETYGHPSAQHPDLGLSGLILATTTIATLASQTSFTLTAGSADDNAYVGCIAVIEDASTAVQKAVGLISAYTGASKTVTLATDPGIFTMAIADKIQILPVPKQLPAAPANAAGGLPISAGGGLALDTKLANTNEVTAARMGALTDLIEGGRLDLLIDAILLDTGTTLENRQVTIATGAARLTAARAAVLTDLINGGRLDLLIDAIKAVTDVLPNAGALSDIDTGVNNLEARLTAARGGYLDELAAANIPTDLATIAGYIDTEIGTLLTRLSAARAGYLDELAAANIPADIDTLLARLTAARAAYLDAAISTRATPAQVNTQMVDALNVDTYAEPGQEAPAATASIVKKIGYLFKFLRNKITNDGTDIKVHNDVGDTVDQKAGVSEAAGTVTRNKFGSGA